LKITEGRPNIVDSIINNEIDLIINTTIGKQSIKDSFSIRRNALDKQIPYVTTIRGALAVAKAIEALKQRKVGVKPIQLYYKEKSKKRLTAEIETVSQKTKTNRRHRAEDRRQKADRRQRTGDRRKKTDGGKKKDSR
jgi:hypothetical protein